MAETVVIDAGHGGYDNGASYNGRLEKDDVLRLALAVGGILESYGVNVVYTRTGDVYDSPVQKARIGNNSNADFFVSLHRNSSPYPNTYSGVQTLLYDNSGIKVELADNINDELAKAGYTNLGISIRPNLAVLRATDMPAALVEVGFINTDQDNRIFDENFNSVANGIAQGILTTIRQEQEGEIPSNFYRVQVGLFNQYNNAQNMLGELLEQGYNAFITRFGNYYVVQVGGVETLQEVQALEQSLKDRGYETLIVY